MIIPDKIKICGKTYTIEIRNNRATTDGYDGAASGSVWSQKIWLDSDQHIEGQEECLFHEVLEIISKEMDFGLSHTVISTLSNILYQVLKDNSFLKE